MHDGQNGCRKGWSAVDTVGTLENSRQKAPPREQLAGTHCLWAANRLWTGWAQGESTGYLVIDESNRHRLEWPLIGGKHLGKTRRSILGLTRKDGNTGGPHSPHTPIADQAGAKKRKTQKIGMGRTLFTGDDEAWGIVGIRRRSLREPPDIAAVVRPFLLARP